MDGLCCSFLGMGYDMQFFLWGIRDYGLSVLWVMRGSITIVQKGQQTVSEAKCYQRGYLWQIC